jgi:hypothetical protein
VRAESDQTHDAEHGQAGRDAADHPQALARVSRCEYEQRQRQPGGHLDADTGHQCRRARPQARVGAGAQRERRCERQQDQRVVVRPADRQYEQHGVQADERRRPAPRLTEPAGGPGDQRDGAEARGDGERLERPQAAGQPERSRGVAEEREQRPVGGMLEGPADEPEDFVARRFGRHMRVRVQAVEGSETGKAHVAEDVLRDQRRPEQQDQVRGHDRRHERADRQGAREQQHEQVARAHDQREGLEGARADAHAQALEGPRKPTRPAAASPRHVSRRFAGGAGAREEDGHDHAEQAEQAERSCRPRPPPGARPMPAAQRVPRGRSSGVDRHAGRGRCGLHRVIVTSSRQAGVRWPG